jgi:hypothetical protein
MSLRGFRTSSCAKAPHGGVVKKMVLAARKIEIYSVLVPDLHDSGYCELRLIRR